MATIPGLVLSNMKSNPNAVALRYKQLGIWKTYTWTNYLAEVSKILEAFKSISIGKGSIVGVYGNNVPTLIFSISAIQSLGGIVVLIHPESTKEELSKILLSSNVDFLIAEDQQQVDRYIEVASECNLKKVIYLDSRGLSSYDNSNLVAFDDITSRVNSSNIEMDLNTLNDKDTAFYLYDEYEDNLYKVSHQTIINNCKKIIELNKLSNKDSIVSYLPLSIPTNLLFTYIASIVSGMSLNLPESNQTIEKDLQEIGPSVLYAPSFVFKHIITSISYRIESASEKNYNRYMNHYNSLMKIYDKEIKGEKSIIESLTKIWLMLTTFNPAKNVFGLTNIKHAFVSDGVLSKVNFDFFHAIGVEIQHSFGQAINCGCISVQPDHAISSENVGNPMKGTEIKINNNSEVLFKTDCLGDPLSGKLKTEDGWINSGYVGMIEESGALIVEGRSDDIITLKSGTKLSPEKIENLISCSPFIKSSIVFGSGQDSLSAIVVIDPKSVNSWADRKSIRYTGYAELASKDEVRDLIRNHIKCVNESFDSEIQIKRFVILHRTFIMSEGEVTKTMGILRSKIAKNLKDIYSAIENKSDSIIVNDIDKLTYHLNVNKLV
jgi:long-chain acyl-CoA synthetase